MTTTTGPMTTEPKKIKCNDTNKDLEGCKIKEELDDVLRKLHRCHVRDQLLPVWITFLVLSFIMIVIIKIPIQNKDEDSIDKTFYWIFTLIFLFCVFIPAIVGWCDLEKEDLEKEKLEKEKERLITLLNKDYPNIDKLTRFGVNCHHQKNSNDRSGGICDGKAYRIGRTVFLVPWVIPLSILGLCLIFIFLS